VILNYIQQLIPNSPKFHELSNLINAQYKISHFAAFIIFPPVISWKEVWRRLFPGKRFGEDLMTPNFTYELSSNLEGKTNFQT
jgi:hypothetical protein